MAVVQRSAMVSGVVVLVSVCRGGGGVGVSNSPIVTERVFILLHRLLNVQR